MPIPQLLPAAPAHNWYALGRGRLGEMRLGGVLYRRASRGQVRDERVYLLSFGVESMSETTVLLDHRVQAGLERLYLRRHTCSDSADLALLVHRVSAAGELSLRLGHGVENPGVETEPGPPLPPGPPGSTRPSTGPGFAGWDLAWRRGRGELSWVLRAGVGGGTDVSHIPYCVEVTHGRSQATTWRMMIVDPTGEYHPLKPGPYHNVFGRSQHHRLNATMSWGGRSFQYTGWAAGFAHSRTQRDGGWFRDLVWRGVDESRPLFLPAQTLPTVRSTRRKITRRSQVARELSDAVGLSISGLNDGPLRLFHRQGGRYGDWLKRLLIGQEWHMRGKQIRCYSSANGEGNSYTYSVETVVRDDSYDSGIEDVVTRLRLHRLAESDDGGLEADEPEVHTTFGTYSKTFSTPLSMIQWITPVQQVGVFSDFVFRNASGNVIAVRAIRGGVWPQWLSAAPILDAVSVEYTFGARPGIQATEGYGEILFSGASGDLPGQSDTGNLFTDPFEVEEYDAELESQFGKIEEDLGTNEQIASEAQAREYLRGELARRKASLFPLRVTVPLNPDITDGTPLILNDATLGISTRRVVLTATHRFHADLAQCSTTFQVGGYI